MFYIIPARKNSKGVPFKNRALFKKTADLVIGRDVIVTTDDDYIERMAEEYRFAVIKRPFSLANDSANIRDVMKHTVDFCGIDKDDTVMMLYLTYPYRKKEDISQAIEQFNFCLLYTSPSPRDRS